MRRRRSPWRLPTVACAPSLRVDPQEIAREASCDIDKDVQRTFPSTRRFHSEEGQTQLRNVLRAYAAYDPEVAYCQGMNFIAGLLLLYMPSEAHAFAALVVLMEDRGLRSFYHRSLSLLQASATCTPRALHIAQLTRHMGACSALGIRLGRCLVVASLVTWIALGSSAAGGDVKYQYLQSSLLPACRVRVRKSRVRS